MNKLLYITISIIIAGFLIISQAQAQTPTQSQLDQTASILNSIQNIINKLKIDIQSLFSREAKAATETIGLVRQDCAGYSNCFTSLSAWEAAYGGITFGACAQGDLVCADKVATAQIDGTWTSADTTAVTIDGWTTDATHYIRIYTTPAARHDGKWNTGKYRLVVANANLWIYEGNTRIEGLQIHFTSLTASNDAAIATLSDTEVYDIRVSGSIIRGPGSGATGTNNNGVYLYAGAAGSKARIWNNIVYDFPGTGSSGIRFTDADFTSYAYNISSRDNEYGYRRNSGTAILKNCLAKGNTLADFNGVMTVDYCASGDATADDNAGTGNRINQTFTFVDEANDDFHIASTDTGAKDYGANLSADANLAFSDDIDGNTRPIGTAWDIGADETYGVIIIIE